MNRARNENRMRLIAPARIHFGLLPGGGIRRCGGLGVMVRSPATILECWPSARLVISGSHQDLIGRCLSLWWQHFSSRLDRIRSPYELPMGLHLHCTAARHGGFGSGTQIAMAVATVACDLTGLPRPPIDSLAAIMHRCSRTAVGGVGFFRGGLLFDRGSQADDDFSLSLTRLPFPLGWPIVLIRPVGQQGLHGSTESAAFQELNRRQPALRARMLQLYSRSIEPAVRSGDYDLLAESLYEFNRLTGEYFAERQHNVYSFPDGARIVEAVRRFGIHAVGQSSWGPCIFAIARHDDMAGKLVSTLKQGRSGLPGEMEIIVTNADNRGFRLAERSIMLAAT